MPALEPYLIEPIFEQFSALLPEREVDHPLGCHRPRIPDRVVFEKLVRVLVFGCAYHRIADATCWASRHRSGPRGGGVVERTSAWQAKLAHKKLLWCTERAGRVIDFWVAFSRLIREVWSRYRWEGRPPRRP